MRSKKISNECYILELENKLYVVNNDGYTLIKMLSAVDKEEACIEISKNYNLNLNNVRDVVNNFLSSMDSINEYDTSMLELNAPIMFQWKITNRCNLSCKHCYVEANNDNYELTTDEKAIILNKIIATEPFSILFTGGECFVDPMAIEYMKEAYRNEIDIRIFTNGLLIDKYIDELIQMSDRLHINVSVDGDKEAHDYIRGNGTYEQVKKNLKLLVDNGISPYINIVINKKNYLKIFTEIESLRDCGIKNIQVSHLNIRGNAIANKLELELSNEEYSEFNQLIKQFIENNKNTSILYKDIEEEKSIIKDSKGTTFEDTWICCAGRSRITVDHLGNVFPCPFLSEKFGMGNLLNNDIEEIWNNENRLQFINFITKSNSDGICKFIGK